jgi:hypothetical protein
MIRLIYRLFKTQILKLYYLDQPKKKGFEGFEKAFVDSNGKDYLKPINDFDLPIQRVRDLETKLMRVRAGLSDENLDQFFDAMEKALGGGRKVDVAMIGHLIIEMRKRKELLLHPDLMFDIVALRYIREDEDPAIVDAEIHRQKVEQFKKDSREGLYDFFYKAGLSQYLPYLSKLENEWNEYWEESKNKIEAMNIHLKDYITESK